MVVRIVSKVQGKAERRPGDGGVVLGMVGARSRLVVEGEDPIPNTSDQRGFGFTSRYPPSCEVRSEPTPNPPYRRVRESSTSRTTET